MRTFKAVLKTALISTAVLPLAVVMAPPAVGAPSYPVHGVIYTYGVIPDDPLAPVRILTAASHPSTFSMMGRVELDQLQAVVPTAMQGEYPAIVPAAGSIMLLTATLTAADSTSTLQLAGDGVIAFWTDDSVTAPNGWHPIHFHGSELATGTGRLSGLHGTLDLTGGYSFYANAGFIVYHGTLTR